MGVSCTLTGRRITRPNASDNLAPRPTPASKLGRVGGGARRRDALRTRLHARADGGCSGIRV